ncbi:MAG: hypothetical protein R6V19_03930 [Armatimonadota bacterium]
MEKHSVARLVILGIGQTRLFDHEKTQFQALMDAAVSTFALVANWLTSEDGHGDFLHRILAAVSRFTAAPKLTAGQRSAMNLLSTLTPSVAAA